MKCGGRTVRGTVAGLAYPTSRRSAEGSEASGLFEETTTVSTEVVDILLATYNGGRFLREQLDSVVGQTYAHWRLLVRDDGSSDGTADILEEYQRRIGERMQIVRDELGRLGPALSFGRLLTLSDAPYATFCDQDDVWMPDRIEQLLAEMRRMERETGAARPILVHSDLQVIDEEGHEISRSFWNYQYLRPEVAEDWRRLVVQNVVTGCATLMNAALRDIAARIPQEAIMHDWWLALVAARFGRVGYVDRATVKYRQHGRNDTGAKRWGMSYVVAKVAELRRDGWQEGLRRTQRQAAAFRREYGSRLTQEDLTLLDGYIGLQAKGLLARRVFLIRNRLLKVGLIRNIGWLLVV